MLLSPVQMVQEKVHNLDCYQEYYTTKKEQINLFQINLATLNYTNDFEATLLENIMYGNDLSVSNEDIYDYLRRLDTFKKRKATV